jgi:hypothetical protein
MAENPFKSPEAHDAPPRPPVKGRPKIENRMLGCGMLFVAVVPPICLVFLAFEPTQTFKITMPLVALCLGPMPLALFMAYRFFRR